MKQVGEYYPDILREIKEFVELANTENPELEAVWQATSDLLDDQFIQTATEKGIARREKILKITPYADDSLDDRRFRVLALWNDKLPYTYRVLQNKLNQLCGDGHYAMTLDAGVYTLDIKLELTRKRMFDEVAKLSRQIVPANIVITVELRYNQYVDLYNKTHGQLRPYKHDQLRNEVIV